MDPTAVLKWNPQKWWQLIFRTALQRFSSNHSSNSPSLNWRWRGFWSCSDSELASSTLALHLPASSPDWRQQHKLCVVPGPTYRFPECLLGQGFGFARPIDVLGGKNQSIKKKKKKEDHFPKAMQAMWGLLRVSNSHPFQCNPYLRSAQPLY